MGSGLLKWLALAVFLWLALTGLPVLLLRWWPPPASAFMLAAQFAASNAHDPAYHLQYSWIPLERISPNAALAVIASEDQQFPFHAGFDVKSIREAIRANERGAHLRGASTISQQVARNLFLWQDQTYLRKALEAWFTVLIETLWPKERILEVYLNIVEFGRGIYGVESAARHFYGQPAARLTQSQAALLAAVLPNPLRMRVDRPSPWVLSRREWILGQMQNLGGTAYLQEIAPAARARSVQGR